MTVGVECDHVIVAPESPLWESLCRLRVLWFNGDRRSAARASVCVKFSSPMKSAFNFRFSILAAALLCLSTSSPALTLGKARSAVLLGQALDLTVPVGLGAGEEVSPQCVEADVYYGDIQQDRSRVSISVLPSEQVSMVSVRIVTPAAVDEPVVTVYVRAGCQHKVSRKYVLLTDVVSEVDVPVAIRVPKAQTPVALPVSVAKQRVARVSPDNAPGLPTKTPKTTDKQQKVQAARPAVVNSSSAGNKPVLSPKGVQRARLKLTPLDLRVDRDPVLKSSDILFDLPIEDLQKRAQAVATWRALNATPEEVLRQDAQLQALDGSIKNLGELTTRNQGALIDLAARLEKAQAERYRNPLVFGLGVGVFVCFSALAFLLMRMRRQKTNAGPWWRESGMVEKSGMATEGNGTKQGTGSAVVPNPVSTVANPQGVASPVADDGGVDIDLEVRESAFTRLMQDSQQDSDHSGSAILQPTQPAPPGHTDFSYSVNATLRAINTQEMLDERQQAEFFMTLGQHEDAIHLLEESIQHNVDANPLVYLDLLKMLHTLSRKAEYEHYRDEFNAVFSGRVPPFAHFSDKGYSLEAYDDVCQHIAALWPTEDALHFVEQCLVRIQDGLTQEFDLEAFRDLLTLHGVLLRIFASGDTNLAPLRTIKAQALGLGADGGAAQVAFNPNQTTPMTASVQGLPSVDLDLSVSNNMLEFEEIPVSQAVPSMSPKR